MGRLPPRTPRPPASTARPTAAAILALACLAGLLPLGFGLSGRHLPAPEALARLLWGAGLGTLAWLGLTATWRRLPDTPTVARTILGLGLGLRLLLVGVPPLLSDDAWRYLWDGLVAAAGHSPYGVAPAAAGLDPVAAQSAAHAAVRAAVNHPQIPTIYPPLAEWGFEAVARLGGPRLEPLRLALALADGLTVLALQRWLRHRGLPATASALYAFAPVPLLESAVGAHLEAWAVALTVAGLAVLAAPGARRGPRAWAGGALLGGAVATKLLPLMALPALLRQAPRALWAVGAVGGLCLLAVLDLGPEALGGLRAYTGRWRGNAGAFELLILPFEQVWPAGPAPVDLPAWAVRAGRALVGGAPPDRLWPDEAAFAAGKALALAVFAAVWLRLAWRARTVGDLLGPASLALCLLSPVFHPWYLCWVLALAVPVHAMNPRPWTLAAGLWCALVWLQYLPRIDWLAAARWAEPAWVRALVYVPVWMVVVFGALTRLNGGPKRPGGGGGQAADSPG